MSPTKLQGVPPPPSRCRVKNPPKDNLLSLVRPELIPDKTRIPPSVKRAADAFETPPTEPNGFLNPSLLTSEKPIDEGETLFECALAAFASSIQSRAQHQILQPPVSTVSHDREMLRFNRMYGPDTPAPGCLRGTDCCVNRLRFCPPADLEGKGQQLGIYLTPAEHDLCLENPKKLEDIGPGLCLLCTRSCTSALVQHYSNYVTNVDQLPRQCGVPMPCTNLVDCPGGYKAETFGSCAPIHASPAVAPTCLVAPNFDLLYCAYDAASEKWRVDQSAIEWSGIPVPNGQRTQTQFPHTTR